MKFVCHIRVCHNWTLQYKCSYSVVDSSSRVIVWFPSPVHYWFVFIGV